MSLTKTVVGIGSVGVIVIVVLTLCLGSIMLTAPPQSGSGIFDGFELVDSNEWPDDDTPPNCPEQSKFKKALKEYGQAIDEAMDQVKSGSGQNLYMVEINVAFPSDLEDIYYHNFGKPLPVSLYRIKGLSPYDTMVDIYNACYEEDYN